jgi:prepilin-type N-terminal cleavage/methylation domain-containing protein
MKVTLTPRPRRGAFTLVELLVVIAIIAILVALTAAGVMKFMSKGEDLKTQNDISQLAIAVQNFQTAFNVPYVPSRIRLYKDLGRYNPTNQYDADSLAYLQRVWPRIKGTAYTKPGVGTSYYINWDGQGPPVVGGQYVDPNIELQGDQCLVFFLGGIPKNNVPPGYPTNPQLPFNPNLATTLGFSTDPFDPSSNTTTRKGPFYEFQSNRLWLIHGGSPVFFSYQDAYGKSNTTSYYAYFSSYGRPNGYFRYYQLGIAPESDCQDLRVSPYAESTNNPVKCANPNSFQIICPGRDATFGRGSMPTWTQTPPNDNTWSATKAGTTAATQVFGGTQQSGNDDLSNFHNTLLGVGQ